MDRNCNLPYKAVAGFTRTSMDQWQAVIISITADYCGNLLGHWSVPTMTLS